MEYKHILKYAHNSPQGVILTFEGVVRAIADSKGISFEEELKNFEVFKDTINNVQDAEFIMKTDEYEEII